MTTIQVGCDLTYSVTKPTSFLFNVAAARTGHQTIREETLQLNPNIQYEASNLGTEAIVGVPANCRTLRSATPIPGDCGIIVLKFMILQGLSRPGTPNCQTKFCPTLTPAAIASLIV